MNRNDRMNMRDITTAQQKFGKKSRYLSIILGIGHQMAVELGKQVGDIRIRFKHRTSA